MMKPESTCRQTVTVRWENGLHLTPCSEIVKVARTFDSDVRIHNADMHVDAKSVFDILTLKAEQGTELVLEASGGDAEAAIHELASLFQKEFESGDS